MDNEIVILSGRIERKQITKGLRTFIANVLLTEDGKELVLRRQDKSGLSDPELDALNGKKIEGTGTIQSYVLVLSFYKEL